MCGGSIVHIHGSEFGENLTDSESNGPIDPMSQGYVQIGDEKCTILHWGRTNITCVSAPNSAGFKNVSVRQFGMNGRMTTVTSFDEFDSNK